MASSQSFSMIQRRISLSPRAGVAGEKRRAVEDDADAAATVLHRLHLGDHVLEEQERAVVDPGQAGPEAAVHSRGLVLLLDGSCSGFHSTPNGGLASK